MRHLSLILSLLLFTESLSICAPDIYTLYLDASSMNKSCCSIHLKDLSGVSCQNSSCEMPLHDHGDNDSHSCCDEGCQCLCCLKIITQNYLPEFEQHYSTVPHHQKVIVQRDWLSFDEPFKCYHPPKVFS